MRKFGRMKGSVVSNAASAMDYMKDRSWSRAARQFRLSESRDAGVEMQFGHALKEAGFLSFAESRYHDANRLHDQPYEYSLQMGHLCKVRGKFEEAAAHYNRAVGIARDTKDAEEVRRVLAFIEPVNHLIEQMAPAPDFVDYYVSSAASKLVRSVHAPKNDQLGKANYSYAFAARGFISTLEDLGYFVVQISNPEFSPVPRKTAERKPMHICFAPPPLARVMKGAYNILHFAWEFSRISSDAENVSAHPFDNWVRMMEAFDEIWLPSQYAVSVISPLVSKPVRWVPTPIAVPRRLPKRQRSGNAVALARALEILKWVPLSIFPRLQQNFANHAVARAKSTYDIVRRLKPSIVPKIFLTILNPHDKRKQLKPLIEAFCEFASKNSDAILLIKTSSPDDTNASINQRILTHQIAEDTDLVHPYVSDRVWLFNGALTDEQLSVLYGLASFFVCTAFAEGQNLPLLESMAHGCVPVSVNHTAMADYITAENAVMIESEVQNPTASLRATYKMFDDFKLNVVRTENVLSALDAAVQLSDESYEKKSCAAIRTVETVFGSDALNSRIKNPNTLDIQA